MKSGKWASDAYKNIKYFKCLKDTVGKMPNKEHWWCDNAKARMLAQISKEDVSIPINSWKN
jgi:hypothetical protein